MSIKSSKKKTSLCEKLMQLMRSFLKFSSFPLTETEVRSSNTLPPPHSHHSIAKQPKNPTTKPPHSQKVDSLNGGGSSSFIKIQGIDNRDIGIVDDGSWYSGMQSSELKASITNLKASDYIRRFHERNKHESVSLVLPPPPPPPPLPRQGRFPTK